MRTLKPFGSDAVATNLERRYSPDQPRDEKGRFGEGSGDKEGGTKDDKVTVYHGTSIEAATKILNEGLKPSGGVNKVVYASEHKKVAIEFAKEIPLGETSNPDDRLVGIVVISDAAKAGLSQAYSSHYTSEPGAVVPAEYISRVEVYSVGALKNQGLKASPVKVLKRSAQPKEPIEVYAAVVFDENEG
jgi:hypothetical protein